MTHQALHSMQPSNMTTPSRVWMCQHSTKSVIADGIMGHAVVQLSGQGVWRANKKPARPAGDLSSE